MMPLRKVNFFFQVTRSSETTDFNRQQEVPNLILMRKPEEPEVITVKLSFQQLL